MQTLLSRRLQPLPKHIHRKFAVKCWSYSQNHKSSHGGGGDAAAVAAFRARLIASSSSGRGATPAAGLDLQRFVCNDASADVRLKLVLSPSAASASSSRTRQNSARQRRRRQQQQEDGGDENTATANDADDEGGGDDGDGGGSGTGSGSDGAVVLADASGHALLLRGASSWARERLLNAGASGGELELIVSDEAEAEAARLLLQVIYSTADPGRPLAGATPGQLVALLGLAARLGVPVAVRAAGAALLDMGGTLPWDAVTAAFSLPALSPQHDVSAPRHTMKTRSSSGGMNEDAAADDAAALAEAAAPLRRAAADALQEELGDLEAAWLSARRRGLLLGLAYEAVRCLLSDGRTRVASEATIFYTASAWLHARGGGTFQQEKGLVACVRVPALRLSYLTGVVAQCPWFVRHVSPAALLDGIAYTLAAPRAAALAASPISAPAPPRDAWALPPRPPSRVARLKMAWDVPLKRLERLHRAAARLGDGGADEMAAPGGGWVYAGMRWDLEIQAVRDDGEGGVTFGLFVTPAPPPGAVPARAPPGAPTALVEARIGLDARGRAGRSLSAGGRMTMLLGREGRGFTDMFEIGAQAEWEEGAWRRAGLVRGGGGDGGGDGDDDDDDEKEATVRVTARVRDVCC